MKLISWNVNGLRACMKKGFADFFNFIDADVVCLQETKLQPHQIEVDFPGYEVFWNSADKAGYSGTAIFTKKEPLNVTYDFGIDEHRHEGRVITAEFEEFYLVCCYTPNSQDELKRLDYRMIWEDDLRAYLCELDKVKPVVYCGDLNVAHEEIDIKNPKSNRMNAGFTDEERAKMTQGFRNPFRKPGWKQWTVDHAKPYEIPPEIAEEYIGRMEDKEGRVETDEERGKMTELLAAGFVDTFRALYPDKTDAYSWWSYRAAARERNVGWRIDYFIVSERLRSRIAAADILAEVHGSDHCPVLLKLD